MSRRLGSYLERRNTTTTNPMNGNVPTTTNNNNSKNRIRRRDAQPVWIKSSLLDVHTGIVEEDDAKSVVSFASATPTGTTGSSSSWNWVKGLLQDNGIIEIHNDPNHPKYHGITFQLNSNSNKDVLLANTFTEDEVPPDDLIGLTHLHEPAVVDALQERYARNIIYTYTGHNILLALNPFQSLPHLYSPTTLQQYTSSSNNNNTCKIPHVFAIAQHALSARTNHSKNQSILVSGESGSGKTVTTKIVLRYLQCESVLQSNPVLESFGNARTIRNDNSSRFGKFIQLHYQQGQTTAIAASIQTYLLEKVRLISQAPGERNYHVFYELLSSNQMTPLKNCTWQDFKLTSSSNTFDRRDGVSNLETYQELRQALTQVGFSQQQQWDILSIPCALLHMSNLTLLVQSSDITKIDTRNKSLPFVLDLMGISLSTLEQALTTTTIFVGRESVQKHLTLEKAIKAMEALMKATYASLFDYIVLKINQTTAGPTTTTTSSSDQYIGVLDIFGFEDLETNSLEQLCINYCNEALQQQFTQVVLQKQQAEYSAEGIEWNFLTYPDNQDVLDLISCQIFAQLQDVSQLAHSTTDASLARTFHKECNDHVRYSANRRQLAQGHFVLHHYAGPVEYSTKSFCTKNKEDLSSEAIQLLLSSNKPLLVTLGQSLLTTTKTKKKTSVSRQFASQLKVLMEKINLTEPHYIKCLKPNQELVPDKFRPQLIAQQLTCAGVLEAVRVSRLGYPYRYPHSDFVSRYHNLMKRKRTPYRLNNNNNNCETLLQHVVPLIRARQEQVGDYQHERTNHSTSRSYRASLELLHVGIQMGRTKVFLRQKALDALEHIRVELLHLSATKLQSVTRMFLQKYDYHYTIFSVICIQRCYRSYRVRCRVRQQLHEHCATLIQTTWRGYLAYYQFSEVLFLCMWCQKVYRGQVVRQQFKLSRTQQRLALQLQQLYRARKARNVLRVLRAEAKSCNVLKKQKDELQQQLVQLQQESQQKLLSLQEENKQLLDSTNDSFEKDARIEDLLHEIEKMDTTIKELSHDCTTKRDTIESLSQECERKDEMIIEKEDVIKSLSHDIEMNCDVIKEKEHKLEKLTMEYQTMDDILKENENRIKRLVQDCETKDNIIKEKDDVIEDLEKEISMLRAQTITEFPLRSSIEHGDLDNKSVYSYFSRTSKSLKTPNRDSNVSLGSRMSRTSRSSRYANKISVGISLLDQTPDGKTCSSRLTGPTDNDTSSNSSRSENFSTAIHSAIRSCDEDAISIAVTNASDNDLNRADDTGKTPLHLAVMSCNIASILLLLDNQSVANAQDFDGNTPLHCAEDYEIVQILLDEGNANPNIPNSAGICALHLATQRRDYKSIELLIKNGANVNVADDDRWHTPLHLIAQNDKHTDLISKSNYNDGISMTGKIAKILCEAQTPSVPDFNYQDRDGNTPLHFAAMLGTDDAGDLISIFLKHGANPNIFNFREQTPLHLFCHNKVLREFNFYHDMLHLLLHHGADPTLCSSSGCTSLHLSLYHQDIDSALQLMAGGAQLHLPWNKPAGWPVFWQEIGSSFVVCLDMLQDKDDMARVLSAVSCEQKWARSRPTCMHCHVKFGRFSRQHHCRHCGSIVCGKCSPNTLDLTYFPDYCNNISNDSGRVCMFCEQLLVERKQSQSLMGKNVYAIHDHSEDVSFLDTNETSFLNDSMNKPLSMRNDF